MLTFNLDSPLLQHQLEQDNVVEKQGMVTYFSKMLQFGIAFLVIGIVIISMYGFPLVKQEDPYRLYFLLFIAWNFITSFLIMMPLVMKNRFVQLLDSQYTQAGLEKIHNCNAYLNMPGMEKHKQYAEAVRSQGRELTNFECDAIIKHWTSQVYSK